MLGLTSKIVPDLFSLQVDCLTDNSAIGKSLIDDERNYKGRKQMTFTQIVYQESSRILFTPTDFSECSTLKSRYRFSFTVKIRQMCHSICFFFPFACLYSKTFMTIKHAVDFFTLFQHSLLLVWLRLLRKNVKLIFLMQVTVLHNLQQIISKIICCFLIDHINFL